MRMEHFARKGKTLRDGENIAEWGKNGRLKLATIACGTVAINEHAILKHVASLTVKYGLIVWNSWIRRRIIGDSAARW